MPNTLGLNRSLGGAIGIIVLVSLLSSGAVQVTLSHLHEASEARTRASQVIRGLGDLRAAMLNQETGLRGYLMTGRDSSLERYRAGRPALDEVVNRLNTLISHEPEPSRLLADAVTAARTWQADIGEAAVHRAANPETRPEAVKIEADGTGKQLFDTFRQRLDAIETLEEANRLAQNARLAQAQHTAGLTLWLGTGLTLLICLAIGIAIRRLIVRPLVRVMTFVERVGAGDLSGRLEAGTDGEVGRLAATLNTMVAGLSDLARTSGSTTADLNAAAAEIRASAQEQAASVEQ